jgi:hypothetical protein
MQSRPTKMRIVAVVASVAALGVVTGAAGAPSEELPGDRSIPFWPHETGALVGTSETFLDVHADGSYYDPSIGHRVVVAAFRAPEPGVDFP